MYKIAIGTSDFEKLINNGCYYIDKTMFIKHIIDTPVEVTLITRPRRFGKTLNMSMLKYYFDCTRENNSSLFEGLKIMEQEEEYTSKQGAYPCIYISLKDIVGSNYEEMLETMKTMVNNLYKEHIYLLESEKIYGFEKEQITDILYRRMNEETIKSAILNLSSYLNRCFEKKVMLLIDEYDVPLQNAYVENYYEEAIKFFKNFFRLTFKDNPYMEKTVLTGVSRVAKESIFSRSK